MVIVGDSYPWIDFVGKEAIRKKAATEMKIYSMTCHLDEMPNASRISNGNKKFNTMTDFINFLRAPTDGQNLPAVPVHHNLPIREKLDLMDCCNTPVVVSKFSAYLDELSRFAKYVLVGYRKFRSSSPLGNLLNKQVSRMLQRFLCRCKCSRTESYSSRVINFYKL